jgi:hypothetical protein
MNLFKRLFAKKKQEEPDELPPEFLQTESPDWLIELKGASLAHGNHFSVRVQLVKAARSGIADVVIMPRKEGEFPRSSTLTLHQPDTDKLFVILGFSFPDDITSVPAPATDVLPIDICIYHREPYSFRAAHCNLGGVWLESKKSGPPVIEISRILLAAAEPTLRSTDSSS